MAKKSLGYVELEWICPNCSTRNPGSRKTCQSCGMPQPDNVEFQQPAQEKIIEDEAKLAEAEAGPDIHCRYCGTRNPATAATCSQCGADLGEGEKRQSGKVLGAHQNRTAEPVNCPACGTANAPDAAKCVQCGAALAEPTPAPPPVPAAVAPAPTPRAGANRGGLFGKVGLIGVVLVLCVCAAAFFMLYNNTEELTGSVSGVSWERSIVIEELTPVTEEAWHDEIPADAKQGTCRSEVRRTQDQPEPGAKTREVCGTPYTVDTGSGFGEVVQECRYEIFEDFCEYTIEEWQEADEAELRDNNNTPRWPDPNLNNKQRLGERDEIYRCHFTTESGEYSYSSSNPNLLERCNIGSRWVLEVNSFNTVTDIEPTP